MFKKFLIVAMIMAIVLVGCQDKDIVYPTYDGLGGEPRGGERRGPAAGFGDGQPGNNTRK